MKWFYAKNGRQFGPITEDELQNLARSGEIALTDLVWNETMGSEWTPASSVIRPPALTSAANSQNMPHGLSPATLTLSKEKTYLGFVIFFACIMWLVAAFSIIWIPILLLFGLFAWIANGLLIAGLRAEAVKVDERQLPALDGVFKEVCAKLQLSPVPELYVIQSGGLLNAFATRHAGRNFVVVYSDLLETYGANSQEIRFLLGHEIGHIKRNHIIKQILLAPGMFIPLLGPAYRRACEASCDRYGAYATSDINGAVSAMMVLSGGKPARTMDPASFAAQHHTMRGFFVSWHELVSGYPTLSQRVSNLLALKNNTPAPQCSRNPFAYFFAFFSFGPTPSGGGNIMITVAVIGLLAAIAIPSFMKARQQAQHNACINNLRLIDSAKEQISLEYNIKEGNEVSPDLLKKSIKKNVDFAYCPGQGTIEINPVGTSPSCSIHGSLDDEMGLTARTSPTGDR